MAGLEVDVDAPNVGLGLAAEQLRDRALDLKCCLIRLTVSKILSISFPQLIVITLTNLLKE